MTPIAPPKTLPAEPAAAPLPWWRVKMMWLVLGVPLAVVVAGFVTFGIAVQTQDVVLPTTSGQAAK